jgi:general secretion pathway protein K
MITPSIRTKQQGVAIIMAMLIVALATSVAAFAAWQQNIWIRQSESLTKQAQALAVSRAALYFGRWTLNTDLQNSSPPNVDDLKEDWASKFAFTEEIEGGSVSSKNIVDQQGLFNINNLAATNLQERALQLQWFNALLAALSLPADLADAVQDFVDEDDQGPKEDLTYLGKTEPYRTANQPIYGIDELYRVEGFTNEVMETLRPFITAIPVRTPTAPGASGPTFPITAININTAPVEILRAVFGSQAGGQIETLRNTTEFTDFGDFQSRTASFLPQSNPPNPATYPWLATNINVKSEYFLVSTLSQFGNTKNGFEALVHRPDPPTGWPKIIWQKQILD